jgi:prepilin-type N-terminal cleavage/methylation domain-containing protein
MKYYKLMNRSYQAAFALIEMAIVITILGLLVASVTAGATLIE